MTLYFACTNDSKNNGEVIVLKSCEIKCFDDEVLILSCLSKLSSKEKRELLKIFEGDNLKENNDSRSLKKFKTFIKQDGGEVVDILNYELMCNAIVVKSVKYNKLISAQDGLFLMCGLNKDTQLNKLQNLKIKLDGKTVIYLIESKYKNKIPNKLVILSINSATLFPEIENKAKYVKENILTSINIEILEYKNNWVLLPILIQEIVCILSNSSFFLSLNIIPLVCNLNIK